MFWRLVSVAHCERAMGAVLEEVGAVRSCAVDFSLRRPRCFCEALRRLYEPSLRPGA